jgi:pimeloyl-ACP methyl ester carboxylesterase
MSSNVAPSIDKVRSADGTLIACERSGSGPNLVIVNGALSDRRSAAGLRPHLDPNFTVIAYDRRGRGDSGDAERYAPEREMDDLAAVLEAGGGRAFVFAQSSGAILAMEAALRGLAVDRLVLNEPPFIVGDSRRRPSADLAERLSHLVNAGDRESAVHLFLTDAVGLSDVEVAGMRSTEAWPAILKLAPTTAYDAALTAGHEMPAAARLEAFEIPTLVTCGGATLPWIQRSTKALAEALPNGRLEQLPGQGHRPAPDVLAPALLEFLIG